MFPSKIEKMPAATYINKGFTPNDSKNTLHFLYPFISMIHIRRASNVDANPHVAKTNVGDHIFLLIGQP